ncbi:cytochrome P450 [Panus rudis PR-1116 ss-1]|nr:cytochrome P450 [Panus rudis PR-1116 ss-1]
MDSPAVPTYALAALLPIFFLFYRWRFANFYDIPTIGPSAPVLSYLGAFRFMKHAREMLAEGYQKHKGGIFKVAMLDKWVIVVTGPKLVDELRKFPDNQVSFNEASRDLIQLKYTFGKELEADPFHIEIIRTQLTRQLAGLFSAIREEIVAAYGDLLPETDDWTPVYMIPIMQHIIARVSSRVFVGLPMCRNQKYLDLAVNHTLAVARTRKLLTWFPEPLKWVVGQLVNESRRSIKLGLLYLQPLIDDRMAKLREYGEDWMGKPNDFLQWTINTALETGRDVQTIVRTILVTNFAAIHTSSNSFTHAIYHLAANPEYMIPLREEVEAVINEEGWTKAAMQKLRKVDSFLRESQRMNGISGISVMRKTVAPITLSTGHHLPAGTMVVAPAVSTHLDDEYYSDPDIFNPWRFSEMREGHDGESTKHQFVSTSVDYIPFGHGRHACPGRFFAANELKAMFAHTVLNYDLKLEDEGVRPQNQWHAISIIPSPTARVLYRKRKD